MLIRLIIRALCRGAYQQCVRYCGTGALLPPHLRRRCLLLAMPLARYCFTFVAEGGLAEELNAWQSGSIFNRPSDQFSDLLLGLTDSSNILLDKTGHRCIYIRTVSRSWRPMGPPSHLDIRGLKDFSKVRNPTPLVFSCFLKKLHFHTP